MMAFLLAGGFPMVLIAVFGLVALGTAGRFAWAPSPGRGPDLTALGAVVGLSGALGLTTDLMAVAQKVPANPEWAASPDLPLIVLTGVGEALTPAVLACGVLVAYALLITLGLRRLRGA